MKNIIEIFINLLEFKKTTYVVFLINLGYMEIHINE